jgi:hypothetical protein
VDDEVLVRLRALQEDQVSCGVAAEAPEARHAKEPRCDHDAHAAHVDRLGIEIEPVEPGLCPSQDCAQKKNRMSRIRMRIAAPMLMYMVPPSIR